jgi:predicted secreted protein
LLLLGSLAILGGCDFLRSKPGLQAQAGIPLAVTLPANFSTGYRWVLDPPVQTAQILSESYTSDQGNQPGSPGQQTFQVVFSREGRFNLKFAYRRLWEPPSVPSANTTNLVIQVLSTSKPSSVLEQLFPPQNPPSLLPQPEEEAPRTRMPLRTTR